MKPDVESSESPALFVRALCRRLSGREGLCWDGGHERAVRSILDALMCFLDFGTVALAQFTQRLSLDLLL